MGFSFLGLYNYYFTINYACMVSDSFIQGKPILSRIIGSLLTAILTLFIGWILLGLDINASKKISSENVLKNKADITYVDKKHGEALGYTDSKIEGHEKTEDAKHQSLKHSLEIYMQGQSQTNINILDGQAAIRADIRSLYNK